MECKLIAFKHSLISRNKEILQNQNSYQNTLDLNYYFWSLSSSQSTYSYEFAR